MCKQIDWQNLGVNINGEDLNHLRFADDIVLISDSVDKARKMLKIFTEPRERLGLKSVHRKPCS